MIVHSKGVAVLFSQPAFTWDSRANKLADYRVMHLVNGASPINWVDLRGPNEVAMQIEMAGKGRASRVDHTDPWTHRIAFPLGIGADIWNLANLLKSVLTLTSKANLDWAMAVDWYKIPDPEVNAMDWPNTETGESVYRGKYYSPGKMQEQAFSNLVERMSEVVDRHCLLREAETVVSIPGHKANGNSFGERLASAIAGNTGKLLEKATCGLGVRLPSKESSNQSLMGHMIIARRLSGSTIIIDDVYRTGNTMSAVAQAVRMAGANHVFGFTAVRTLRN